MSNIVPFPFNQSAVGPKPPIEETSPLEQMENARAKIQDVFARLTAIHDELTASQAPAVPESDAATLQKRGTQS